MTYSNRVALCVLTCAALLLGACALPTTYTPSPLPSSTDEEVPYTAAAATIAAQLTDIAIVNTTGIVPDDGNQESTPADGAKNIDASATLPSTSTPLPSKTPLPSDTPTPSDTPEPSLTPTITNTAEPTEVVIESEEDDPTAELGEPDWQDNFESAANWALYNDEHVEMRITANNRLEMTSLEADKWESWMLMVNSPMLENFYLEAVASPGECFGSDRYGLVARSARSAKQFYAFGLTCDGRYSFRVWDGETFTNILGWTPSNSINTGTEVTNILGMKAEGNQISLFVNDKYLTTIQDETFTQGMFGLFVGGPDTAGFSAWFDQVSYWELFQ